MQFNRNFKSYDKNVYCFFSAVLKFFCMHASISQSILLSHATASIMERLGVLEATNNFVIKQINNCLTEDIPPKYLKCSNYIVLSQEAKLYLINIFLIQKSKLPNWYKKKYNFCKVEGWPGSVVYKGIEFAHGRSGIHKSTLFSTNTAQPGLFYKHYYYQAIKSVLQIGETLPNLNWKSRETVSCWEVLVGFIKICAHHVADLKLNS